MKEDLHTELVTLTESLRDLLSSLDTYSVTGWVFTYELHRANADSIPTDLFSPAKQIAFLLGLLLSTPEPVEPKDFEQHDWEEAKTLLNSIFNVYGRMFIEGTPDDDAAKDLWQKNGDVTMPAFLHYFNTDMHASNHQICNRITRYLAPFDADLERDIGISASDGLEITAYLIQRSQAYIDKMYELREEKNEYDAEVGATIDNMFIMKISEIKSEFGEDKTANFLNLMAINRGDTKGFMYLTDTNEADVRALICAQEGMVCIPRIGAINLNLVKALERAILSGERRAAYLSRRDKELEDETRESLERIFGDTAQVLHSVYETPTQQNEHDLVVIYGSIVLLVECKASPPVEPFRDPDKAYTRIKRHFGSDRGIQYGYEQAKRIKDRLDAGETVELYQADGQVAIELDPTKISDSYCLIVTRDNFGTLGIDLTLLLEKNETDPYPVSINSLDLYNIAETWEYFGYPGSKLIEYLDFRSKRPNLFIADDELDVMGHFLRYGLEGLPEDADTRIFADPNNSGVFDDVFRARHLDGPEVKLEQETFEATVIHDNRGAATGSRPSQRAPCPCGSGIPYKRCCGTKRWS